MSHLNLHLDYLTHPKTVRLIGLLGKGAEMLPIKLWLYCGKYHAESGRFIGYSAREIESVVGWWGKEGAAVDAMIKVEVNPGEGGFLRRIKDGYEVVDWFGHQGHLAAFKKRARAGAAARWDDLSNASSNAKRRRKQYPIPTIPTKLTRRKKKKKKKKDLSASPHAHERLLSFWGVLYYKNQGSKYIANFGKDTVLLRDEILPFYSEKQVRDMMRKYFETIDEPEGFHHNKTPSIALFKTVANDMVSALKKEHKSG